MSRFSWSYSMYSQACNCLACFEKSYVLNLPQPGLESADLLFGTAMHSAVNSVWKGEDGLEVFHLFWSANEGKQLDYSRFNHAELRDIGEKFLLTFQRKHAGRFQHESSEIRLYGEHKGIGLEGQYDFYGLFDGETSLLDLKTSAYAYKEEKKDVALQLNLYAYLAMQNGYKTPKNLGYIVLCKNTGCIQTPMLWEFDEKKCLEFVDDMATYCRMFETLKRFPRNPNSLRHNYPCYSEVK